MNMTDLDNINLTGDPPQDFQYVGDDISQISGTDEFQARIDARDKMRCIVCGIQLVTRAHIIGKAEVALWSELKDREFIPKEAKSVKHEPRNGILLCPNHHVMFDWPHFNYFIRWIPDERQFVLVNHSRVPSLEDFHGKAVNIDSKFSHVPFYMAFLLHEARVRGFWSHLVSRTISLPITLQSWMLRRDELARDQRSNLHETTDGEELVTDEKPQTSFAKHSPSPNALDAHPRETLVLSDPFSNPAELAAFKAQARTQPSWKAAVIEGGGWGGTAEENIARYLSNVTPDNEEEP